MVEEITRLEHPIEAMWLIHKALRVEAEKVEEMVRNFQCGESIQPIKLAFNCWAASLIFHADQEDRYMTAPMPSFPPARENEAEHAELAVIIGDLQSLLEENDRMGLSDRVEAAIIALHDEQHLKLMELLEDVMATLNDEIGKGRVIPRTHRHLYGRIVALRVSQDDHLESEEAFILPEICQRFSEDEQLEIIRQLLIDESADDPRWALDWVTQNLSPAERRLLEGLIARFSIPASTA